MADGEVAKYWKTAGIGGIVVVVVGAIVTALLSNGNGTSGNKDASNVVGHTDQQVTSPPLPTLPPTTADQIGGQTSPTPDLANGAQTSATQPPATTWYNVTLGTVRGGQPDNGQVVIGGKLFSYLYAVDPNTQIEGARSSTCRSITITAGVPDSRADTVTGTGSLSVITEIGTESMTIKVRTLATKTFELGPSGAFKFGTALNSYYAALYWNATLSCSTPNGQ